MNGRLENDMTREPLALDAACRRYNDRPLRALRAENPVLLEDGATVVSDGVEYRPSSLRDMLGWLVAGQWDAQGPDDSVAPDENARPAHRRLASWWHRRVSVTQQATS